ncbi:HotDog domain-containing protein [Multifurca ochricompacta]|uniref:HotDog domain-containing protein n=1 Tax=Multifurca ochricompacta TaxID=376703 RepID=A0AAD4MBR9_9AGAM|nr:HotDog domain-containing protein [Multifurca ochricompacta]
MSHPIHRSALTIPQFVDREQSEPLDISSALDVEQLDTDLFRSRSLYLPYRARGVFGGQVISQSLVAATRSVKPEFALHVSPATPVLYYVDRVRDGKSYATRFVRAVQSGNAAFVMMCSFQLPEHWQPSRYWQIPQVTPPESCPDEVELIRRMVEENDRSEGAKSWLYGYAQSREESPVAVKHAGQRVDPDGRRTFLYWMKAKTSEKYPASLQKVVPRKCILAYISDIHFIGAAITSAGLKRSHEATGPQALGMAASLDHSLVYYCEWFLYVMTSPVSGHGRGYGIGLLYARDGTLLAVANQEGVMRANVRPPMDMQVSKKARM